MNYNSETIMSWMAYIRTGLWKVVTNNERGYFDSLGYKGLFDCLESLRKTTGEILNRDEIDRIMWYCYRYE